MTIEQMPNVKSKKVFRQIDKSKLYDESENLQQVLEI